MAAAIPIPAQLLQRQCLAAIAILAGFFVGPANAAPLACKGPAQIRTGDAAAIASHVKATGKM
jgi:hypothetical protein